MPNSMRYCQTCRLQFNKRGFKRHTLSVVHRKGKLIGSRSAYISGKLCVQRQACWHDVGSNEHKYTFLSIRQPTVRFDICAWKLPDGRFLILPKKLTGFRQTTFNPEESDRLGTNSSSHYYRQHIERWSLLGRPRRSK